MICTALADRYPIIVGDEHQDSSPDQDSIMMAIHQAESKLRVFGDPMQRIYGGGTQAAITADSARWEEMKSTGAYGVLDKPHRWRDGHEDLGQWILQARESLRDGNPIDLTGSVPRGLTVLYAENLAPTRTGYQVSKNDRKSIDQIAKMDTPILILTGENETVNSLCAFWNRAIPI